MHVKKNQKAYWKNQISGIRQPPDIRPDIRIRFFKTRLSRYPVSGFKISIRYNPTARDATHTQFEYLL